ncbi:MAG: MarC family protein [Dysgonamonadaceae bacterium]|nr:MarC family protein [Dysgonamonadaceae bacterium]MDD4728544.1 MarC family protein [Dysgonamonadaceae bacterium]
MFQINYLEIVSTFIVLFAIIDATGSVPIFLNLRSQDKIINAEKASFYSLAILLVFLFVGEWILKLFQVDLQSFAVAGALVILIISIEMIFGVEIFKNDSPSGSSTLVPVVFPLIAGPGSFTTLLSMRAEFQMVNILIALVLNMLFVYFVLKHLDLVKKVMGVSGVYILRKLFGVILMAISVRLITANMSALIHIVGLE